MLVTSSTSFCFLYLSRSPAAAAAQLLLAMGHISVDPGVATAVTSLVVKQGHAERQQKVGKKRMELKKRIGTSRQTDGNRKAQHQRHGCEAINWAWE
jgi:hypothetical protein